MKAAAASIVVTALSVLSPAAGAQQDLWDRAAAAYDTNHFQQALALYEQLAQGGSARAAEIAGTMLVCGEALYGKQVPEDRARAALLLQGAAKSGSPVAQLLLGRISVASPAAAADEAPADVWSEPTPFGTASAAD